MYRYNASNFQPTMRQDSNGNRGMAIEEKIQSPFSKQQQVKVQFSYIWSLNPSWKLNHDSNPNINRALILLARASNHSLDNAKAMQCQKKMSYAMQCYSTSNSRGISFPWGNDKGASIPGFAACTCLITSLQSLGDASDREKRGVTSACQSTSNTADPAPCHGGPADETVCERQRIPISWRSIQQSGMGEKPPSQSNSFVLLFTLRQQSSENQNFPTTVEIEGGLWSPQLLAFDRPRGSNRQVTEEASLNPEPQTLTIWSDSRSPHSYVFPILYTTIGVPKRNFHLEISRSSLMGMRHMEHFFENSFSVYNNVVVVRLSTCCSSPFWKSMEVIW